ncbi:putative S-adenosyl-L-methionine-dependent methyltransferase [Cocos nucifera]|uniref:Putative S-adenosyl-L-methionine-dependent methyltransferase n=1 Tax=Cocos nucifera TaxID=13894 RepID=A0A8K0IVL5_COCNU|nr:putative S-adenosyl-L-methionine-dependent methyltransferase [Cocos nucifera]
MSEEGRLQGTVVNSVRPEELKLPELLKSATVRSLHATIDHEWDPLQRSACQTAAGRALWNHVIHDPVAEVLAGENFLRSLHEKMRKDQLSNAREVSGVILAVRTLWFDSRIEAAINSFEGGRAQVVLLGAGMDARAYRLSCLKECNVFEVDFPDLLQTKADLIQEAIRSAEHQQIAVIAKSLIRVAADIRDGNWLEELQRSGFAPERNTVWVLEGILYYLPHLHAMQVLQSIAANCALTPTILLADFMNKCSISISHSTFQFYSDWPDHLLPTLGFSNVKLSQIGDPDAHFGLLHDPQNLFNKLRNLPRSLQTHPEDGTPCRRLYLVEASGFPNQATA